MTKWLAALTAVGGAFLVSSGVAFAQALQPPFFRALTDAGINRPELPPDRFFIEDHGSGYLESTFATNASLNFTKTYTGGPQGDITFSANAATNFRGAWSTGNHAQGTVTNAYPGWTEGPLGYYVIGGGGTWARHRFVSPESLTGPFSVFNWHVTGTGTTNLGRATSRLDFAVASAPVTSFDDLYNPSVSPNILTEFGPGSYSYNTAVAIGVPLDFLFWSSAFWEVTRDDVNSLTAPQDLFGVADFFSTTVLESVALFNGDGTPVTQWDLVDVDTGRVIFNENGRVAPLVDVPEPATGALLVTGLLPLAGAVAYRRRSCSA